MATKRFQPLDIEVSGYIKTFLILWVVSFVVWLIIMGASWWSFYGAIGLATLSALVITIVLSALTGFSGDINITDNKGGKSK